jgi:hypothetical protein
MAKAVAKQILVATSASLKSDWFENTQFNQMSLTVRATSSAASLVGVLTLRGTNNFPQDTTEPELITGVALTKSPAGVTYSAANGTITYASPAASPVTITIAYAQMPQFVQADWVYTSGGGTVTLIVTASGWGVG